MVPLIPEIFGDGGRDKPSPQTNQRQMIGGGNDDDRFFKPVGPQIPLDKIVQLPAPLTDKRQITFTSAEVLLAIIPIRTLLPTPDPAKIPIR